MHKAHSLSVLDRIPRLNQLSHPLCAGCVQDLGAEPPLPVPMPGHDEGRPTDWLAEGLLPYLSVEAQIRLLKCIDRASAPGSRACLNFFEAPDDEMPTLNPGLIAQALPSWDVAVHRYGDERLNYGRVPKGLKSTKFSFALAVKI